MALETVPCMGNLAHNSIEENQMLNEKQFNSTVKSIAKTGAKLAADIHAAGVYAVAQSYNGNPNPAKALVAAVHSGIRGEAVKAWLVHFGALKWDGQAKAMAHRTRKDVSPDKIDGMVAECEKTPYWLLTKEVAVGDGQYDVLAHLLTIIKAAENIEAGKSQKFHTVKNAAVLAKVKKAMGNEAANDVVTESADVTAIAASMAKRNDALELFKAMADQLGFDMDFPSEEQRTGTEG